ncbi:MAG: ferritin-like domain-containing protein, partial [Anaerolineae bacterium]|jgi:bacterioferritin (cytochrome b1)
MSEPMRTEPTRLAPDEILAGLNRALRAERQAVADYDAHARACERLDVRNALETLRDVEREHGLRLARRITALGGSPVSEPADARPLGESLADWLADDLQSEQWAILEYARLVAGIVDDDETVELMTELLVDEIRHATWLKSTLRALAHA